MKSYVKHLKTTKNNVVVYKLLANTRSGTHTSKVYYAKAPKGFKFLGVYGIAGFVPSVAECVLNVSTVEELTKEVSEIFGAEVTV